MRLKAPASPFQPRLLGYIAKAAVLLAPWIASSQETRQFAPLYTNSPLNLEAAQYHGGFTTFTWLGGNFDQAGQPAIQGAPVSCRFMPGSMVQDLSLSLKNAKFLLDAVQGSNLVVRSMQESVLAARNSQIRNLVLFGADPARDRRTATQSSIQWNNCVLEDVQAGNILASLMRLTWDNCLFHRCILTPQWLTPHTTDELTRNGSQITGCRFINCLVSYDFLSVTKDCVFEYCQIAAPPAGSPINFEDQPRLIRLKWINTTLPDWPNCPKGLSFENSNSVKDGCILPFARDNGSLLLNFTGSRHELSALVRPLNSTVIPPSLASFPTNPPPVTPAIVAPAPIYVPVPLVANLPGGDVPVLPGSTSPSTSPMSSAPGASLKRIAPTVLKAQLSHVNGLMIMKTEAGAEAGLASRMNAAAVPAPEVLSMTVAFNQKVGESMDAALREVTKFTHLQHSDWPEGYQVELGFEDKYVQKDGPSAAVACALLLNALFTGQQNDPLFAVTGDMNADGEVQPIGGVPAKIRGATNGRCKYVGIPAKNETSLSDLLLLDGPGPLAGIQVFAISVFDDAAKLAAPEKNEKIGDAIIKFSEAQQVLNRNPAQVEAMLHNPFVISKLEEVLRESPNHMSAKYLLLYGKGLSAKELSLSGSIEAIDDAAAALIVAIKSNNPYDKSLLKRDDISESIRKIRALRAKFEPRVRPYAETVIHFGEVFRDVIASHPQTDKGIAEAKTKIRAAADSAGVEWNRLSNDPRVIEDLRR